MAASTLRREPADLAEDAHRDLRIVLVGKSGYGKSATGNLILGEDRFESRAGQMAITKLCKKWSTKINGRNVRVIDTPGLHDNTRTEADIRQEIARCLCFSVPGPHVFLFFVNLNARFAEDDMTTYHILRQLFADSVRKFIMVVFTHGDSLLNSNPTRTIEDVLHEAETIAEKRKRAGKTTNDINYILKEVSRRYIVINNVETDETKRDAMVAQLLEKINEMAAGTEAPHYFQDETLRKATEDVEAALEKIMRIKNMDRREAWEELENQLRHKKIWSNALSAMIGAGLAAGIAASGGLAALPVAGAAAAGGTAGGIVSFIRHKCSLM